jgi:hypothetical protein
VYNKPYFEPALNVKCQDRSTRLLLNYKSLAFRCFTCGSLQHPNECCGAKKIFPPPRVITVPSCYVPPHARDPHPHESGPLKPQAASPHFDPMCKGYDWEISNSKAPPAEVAVPAEPEVQAPGPASPEFHAPVPMAPEVFTPALDPLTPPTAAAVVPPVSAGPIPELSTPTAPGKVFPLDVTPIELPDTPPSSAQSSHTQEQGPIVMDSQKDQSPCTSLLRV